MMTANPAAERGEPTGQLREAVASFLDDPGGAVAGTGSSKPDERPATEELRVAMRDYRDIAGRLPRR